MRMRCVLLVAALLPLAVAHAAPWEFEQAIAVTEVTGPKLFHHLESSGRRNVAVSGERVAVAWEDDRDGIPRIHVAQKAINAPAFEVDIQISSNGEAFEPSIIGLGGGRFAVAWEEDGRGHVRVLSGDGLGPEFTLEAMDSVQVSLAANSDEVLLVTAERTGRFAHIALHRLQVGDDGGVRETARCAVDPEPPKDEQLYPAVSIVRNQVVVAWEDRRTGHTVIMAAASESGAACRFPAPQRISLRSVGGRGKMPYGKGHGVSRVALGSFGPTGVFAAWADKRNFREGYDIYGATWEAKRVFGSNERVQDEFGSVARQWHASVAGHPNGTLVVAWDDDREGDPDILLSWRTDEGWSEDTALPGASGAGVQAHPSIALDAAGNLHAAWVERETINGPTRLRYAIGRWQD
jgi:hypothetical protein